MVTRSSRTAGTGSTSPTRSPCVTRSRRRRRPSSSTAPRFNDVDGAEDRAAEALAVNAFAVRSLARAAEACGATFVHFGTDFVFDGAADRALRRDGVAVAAQRLRIEQAARRLVRAGGAARIRRCASRACSAPPRVGRAGRVRSTRFSTGSSGDARRAGVHGSGRVAELRRTTSRARSGTWSNPARRRGCITA